MFDDISFFKHVLLVLLMDEVIQIKQVKIIDAKALRYFYRTGQEVYVTSFSCDEWEVLHRNVRIPKESCEVVKIIEIPITRYKNYPYNIRWPEEWCEMGDTF